MVFFFNTRYYYDTVPFGWGLYFQECAVETDQKWVWGVGAGDKKSGSSARVWRSLDADQHVDVEAAERGQHDNNNEEDCRVGRSGEIWRRGDL
jgi:hypothetical protein